MSHDPDLAARVFSLTESRAWGDIKAVALAKVARHEASVSRLIFRTRTPVEEAEIEYSRGFYQGVMYVVEGLPNTITAEFRRGLKESDV